jgi:hypothetical protein
VHPRLGHESASNTWRHGCKGTALDANWLTQDPRPIAAGRPRRRLVTDPTPAADQIMQSRFRVTQARTRKKPSTNSPRPCLGCNGGSALVRTMLDPASNKPSCTLSSLAVMLPLIYLAHRSLIQVDARSYPIPTTLRPELYCKSTPR